MSIVELYVGLDCHLCEAARDTLMRARRTHPFEFRMITIREGEGRYEEFKERIPVVFINGKFAFQFRVPVQELIRRLNEG